MTSKPWMPLYIGDYKRDTAHLTTLEHGAYLLLIMHYWETGPLPNDDVRLARIAGLSLRQWRTVRRVVISFFVEANAKQLLRHNRIDSELIKAENITAKRALAGAKGGFANRGKTNQERNYRKAFAKQTVEQSQSHSNLTSFPSPRARGYKGEFEEGS
jgi:uncharacterized protein YdaU (DUF1376 family)